MIELLAVISILAILSAFLYPALSAAKRASLVSRCGSNLRQAFLAVKIYQADHDGADVGSYSDMGLPPPGTLNRLRAATQIKCPFLPSEIIRSPRSFPYVYVPGPPIAGGRDYWAQYIALKGPAAVLFYDINHNPLSESVFDETKTHSGISVHYGGHVRHLRKKGIAADLSFFD